MRSYIGSPDASLRSWENAQTVKGEKETYANNKNINAAICDTFSYVFALNEYSICRDSKTGAIKGTVAIIMRNGDVKPLARRWFMVAPFSVLEQRINLKPGSSAESEKKWLDAIEELYAKANSENKVHFIQTDFQGNYELNGLPPGRYCIEDDSYRIGPREWKTISANSPIGKCFIHWAYWFEIKVGQNLKIDLSNDNSKELDCY